MSTISNSGIYRDSGINSSVLFPPSFCSFIFKMPFPVTRILPLTPLKNMPGQGSNDAQISKWGDIPQEALLSIPTRYDPVSGLKNRQTQEAPLANRDVFTLQKTIYCMFRYAIISGVVPSLCGALGRRGHSLVGDLPSDSLAS
jgi:hypothetical protein